MRLPPIGQANDSVFRLTGHIIHSVKVGGGSNCLSLLKQVGHLQVGSRDGGVLVRLTSAYLRVVVVLAHTARAARWRGRLAGRRYRGSPQPIAHPPPQAALRATRLSRCLLGLTPDEQAQPVEQSGGDKQHGRVWVLRWASASQWGWSWQLASVPEVRWARARSLEHRQAPLVLPLSQSAGSPPPASQ